MENVLTLQFGRLANYVGAHWWNIYAASTQVENQDSPPPSPFFLPSSTESESSTHEYKPFTLIFDETDHIGPMAQYSGQSPLPTDAHWYLLSSLLSLTCPGMARSNRLINLCLTCRLFYGI